MTLTHYQQIMYTSIILIHVLRHLTGMSICHVENVKRDLVLYLGASLMQYSTSMIRGQQRVILAGCFPGEAEDQAWAVSTTGTQPLPTLNCGADTHIWLHVLCSQYSCALVCSPDTDVYHIGFPLIVQLNAYTSIEHQYLWANQLRLALNHDPDLAAVEADNRLALLQALFIATGCDYTSFCRYRQSHFHENYLPALFIH